MKVRTLCILCNNWCLFCLWSLTPVWLGVAFYTVWAEFPRPDRQTVYIQNRDRSSLVIESIIYDNWSMVFSSFNISNLSRNMISLLGIFIIKSSWKEKLAVLLIKINWWRKKYFLPNPQQPFKLPFKFICLTSQTYC